MARGVHPLLRRPGLLPHEVRELDEEDLVRVEEVEGVEAGVGGEHVERIHPEPEVRMVGGLDDFPRLGVLAHVPPPRQPLVGDADPERHREHRKLAEVAGEVRAVAGRVGRGGRADEQHLRAEGLAHAEHRFGDVDLVGVEMARQSLEVAQHLEAGRAEAALAHEAGRGRFAAGMARDVARRDHDLREARLAHRPELRLERPGEGDRVHPEIVDVHRASPAQGSRWLTTSSKVTPPR